MVRKAILIDTTFCVSCNTCTYKCVQVHRLHDLASEGFLRRFVVIKDHGMYHFTCMHCQEPSCARACPTGAIYKTAEGPVLYNPDKCIGCRSCVLACPFHVPQWDEKRKIIIKCTMCVDRLIDGLPPACVEACPTEAMKFGDYEQIVEEAKSLALERNLKIYGLEENGGTSIILLTKEEPSKIGYPKVPVIKLGTASTIGLGVVAAALAYTGLRKFAERAEEVRKAELKEKQDAQST